VADFIRERTGVTSQSGLIVDRWRVIREAMSDIKPLGEGLELTHYTRTTAHHVPLILVQQLGWPGIAAALCWLWVSLYCLVKTRLRYMKYVWLAILALSVWDHSVWTQFAPLWWAVVGVSVVNSGVSVIETRLERA
jgi:hypothetical protein